MEASAIPAFEPKGPMSGHFGAESYPNKCNIVGTPEETKGKCLKVDRKEWHPREY